MVRWLVLWIDSLIPYRAPADIFPVLSETSQCDRNDTLGDERGSFSALSIRLTWMTRATAVLHSRCIRRILRGGQPHLSFVSAYSGAGFHCV
jgi:hypothetical protein